MQLKLLFFSNSLFELKKCVSILKKGVDMIIKGNWYTKGNLNAF